MASTGTVTAADLRSWRDVTNMGPWGKEFYRQLAIPSSHFVNSKWHPPYSDPTAVVQGISQTITWTDEWSNSKNEREEEMKDLLLDLAIEYEMSAKEKDRILKIMDAPDWQARLLLFYLVGSVCQGDVKPRDLGIKPKA